MARIGNECKLVLKLAAEKAQKRIDAINQSESGGVAEFERGVKNGLYAYGEILQDIVTDIERS